MGNCLRRSHKISAHDHEIYEAPLEICEAKVRKMKTSSELEAPKKEQSMKKKVRFKTQKDVIVGEGDRGNTNSRSGEGVRIRVVMTQGELKRMLSCNNDADDQHTTLEQLLSAVKLRGGRICEVGECDDDDDGSTSSWRPALESIPEDI